LMFYLEQLSSKSNIYNGIAVRRNVFVWII